MFISDERYYYNVILKSKKEEVEDIIDTANKKENYVQYDIAKKNGTRTINAIDKGKKIYILQKNLQSNFLCKIPLPKAVKGFIKGEGYNSYLSGHISKKFFLRIDISNFFDSITIKQIDYCLKEFVTLGEIRNNIIEICTIDKKVPQGGVTSPTLSNIIFRFIDQRITKYCQCFVVDYTRYADDMLFSSNSIDFANKKFFYNRIRNILEESGFTCNTSKKIITSNRISLSGYVISNDIHLSRKKLNNINKLIYFFSDHKEFDDKKFNVDKNIIKNQNLLKEINKLNILEKSGQAKVFSSKNQLIDFLCGYRSFIISILKSNNNITSYTKQMSKKVKNIELVIDNLID